MRVLVFGDSTAQGYYDLERGGWANRLFIDNLKHKLRLPENTTEFFNCSVSGDTTKRIIKRLKTEVEGRRWNDEPFVLVFAVGVNDTLVNNDTPLSSPAKYRADLKRLHSLAKTFTDRIVYVGLEAVNEAESAPWKFNPGPNKLVWTNERIRLFDEVLQRFAEDRGARFVPIFGPFLAQLQQGKRLCADGLHPNADGHEFMYDLIRPIIEEAAGAT